MRKHGTICRIFPFWKLKIPMASKACVLTDPAGAHTEEDMTASRFLLLLCCFTLASCAGSSLLPSEPDVSNPMPTSSPKGSRLVTLGNFKDSRKLPPTYLGMIHGPKGQPGIKLETSLPVTEIVARGFGHGLRSQGWASEDGPGYWTLTGEIREFTCDRFERSGATVDVVVRLTKTGGTQPSFNKSYLAEKISATAADPAAMQALADEALQQAVSSLMRDNEFIQVVSGQ